MKALVIYYSKTGNTKKIAEAIAEELKAELKSVDEPIEVGNYDLICVGTSVYAGCVCSKIKNFMNNLPNLEGKKTAGFCTMALIGAKSTLHFIKEKFQFKKAVFLGGFSSISQTGIFFGYGPRLWAPGRPNERDVEGARSFARSLVDL